MAYFSNREPQKPHERVFRVPVAEDDPYAEDGDFAAGLSPEEFAAQEEQEEQRSRFRLYAGIADLVGVVVGTLVILLAVALIISLGTWIYNDMTQSFTVFQTWFTGG